jgi:hypothetical protein
MHRVKRAHWNGKGLKGSPQEGWRKFDQRDTLNESTRLLAMRLSQTQGVEPGPYLVFEQPARDQRFGP